jgi:hypothetical protein
MEVAIQALALNERRKPFQSAVLKTPPRSKVLKQCSFLSAHSDVSGGNEDTGLANLALVTAVGAADRDLLSLSAKTRILQTQISTNRI